MTRPRTFHRTLFVVMSTAVTLSVPGSTVAQHSEGPALLAPSAGLQAPPDRATEPPALEAGGHSDNGLQNDLRAWLQPYTQPRVFITAALIVDGSASGPQRG